MASENDKDEKSSLPDFAEMMKRDDLPPMMRMVMAVLSVIFKGLGGAMKGLEISQIPAEERLQERGW